MGEPAPPPYEFIRLETFERNLKDFHRNDRTKIEAKIKEMLSLRPYEYQMLVGKIVIKGVKLAGLRHMKVGVSGIKGGAVVLYRICEECKKNEYFAKSDVQCQFCDDRKNRHIVLFDVHPRSYGY
jgi:hypothetical protein